MFKRRKDLYYCSMASSGRCLLNGYFFLATLVLFNYTGLIGFKIMSQVLDE